MIVAPKNNKNKESGLKEEKCVPDYPGKEKEIIMCFFCMWILGRSL